MAESKVAVPGGELAYHERGDGEPILFIQTALTADELRPLALDPALEDHRCVLYHRRGYAASSPVDGPGSIVRDAADAAALLTGLGISHAHIVGLSFSCAIAMELAAAQPGRAASLTLIEPPPVHTHWAETFRAANDDLLAAYRERGGGEALDEFLTRLMGPGWEPEMERLLPGAVQQMREDAGTFFEADLPALVGWSFDHRDAARVTCPVLYVGGSASGEWFASVHTLMLEWFPSAEDVLIDGADHSLALTHAPQVAAAISRFLRHLDEQRAST